MAKKQMQGVIKQIPVINCTVPFIDVNYSLYKARAWKHKYVQMGTELITLKGAIEAGLPYLIEGDKGIGKTMAVNEVCLQNKIPVVSFSCSSGTTIGDIIGREHLVGDNSAFKLGVLPTAIDVANYFGKGILYLDELNALEPEVQKMLNPVIDARRSIEVNNKLFTIEKGVVFDIIATMNPSYYAGTNPLNEDLRSRFIGEVWEYPSAQQIEKVINWEDIPEKEVKKPLLQLAIDTLSLKKSSKVEYVISVRDIALFCDAYRVWNRVHKEDPLPKTIQTAILIKFSDATERDIIRERAGETFGVEIPK